MYSLIQLSCEFLAEGCRPKNPSIFLIIVISLEGVPRRTTSRRIHLAHSSSSRAFLLDKIKSNFPITATQKRSSFQHTLRTTGFRSHHVGLQREQVDSMDLKIMTR